VEKTITNRIERWLNQMKGIRQIESRSVAGVSMVTAIFRPDADPKTVFASARSLARSDRANLPPHTLPPVLLWMAPARMPALGIVAIGNAMLEEGFIKDLARLDVRNRLGALPDVIAPVVFGGKDRTIRIILDARKLEAYRLSALDVIRALDKGKLLGTGAEVALAGGEVRIVPSKHRLVIPDRKLARIEDFNALLLSRQADKMVFLRDVGQIEDAWAVSTARVRLDGRPAVCLPIYGLEGADPDAVRQAVRQALSELDKKLPRGTRLRWLPLGNAGKRGEQADTGLVTLWVRAPSGDRLDATEKHVAAVEDFLKQNIPARERFLIMSEMGLTPDESAAFTPNAGEQDAIIRVQLSRQATSTGRDYAQRLRGRFRKAAQFQALEVRCQGGGPALLGPDPEATAPLAIRISGGRPDEGLRLAHLVRRRVARVAGAVDAAVVERADAPYLVMEVDRRKAAEVGLSASDVMVQAVAAMKMDCRVSPTGVNFYSVMMPVLAGARKTAAESLHGVAATGTKGQQAVPLASLVRFRRTAEAVEIRHVGLARVYTVVVEIDKRPPRTLTADIHKVIKDLEVPRGMRVEIKRK
jgi:multidrug efflux pump subunit AcrB